MLDRDLSNSTPTESGIRLTRRRALAGAAWSVPIITVAAAAPAFAGSGLTRVSAYSTNFDSLATGLPVGLKVYTAATTAALGTERTLGGSPSSGSPSAWGTNTGGFFNNASFTGLSQSATATTQAAHPNRALGFRASGGFGGDPGGAIVVTLADTTNRSALMVDFKAFQLDPTAGGTPPVKTVSFVVDALYEPGPTRAVATPTPAFSTTFGTQSSVDVSVSFGSLLDNIAGPVSVRIFAQSASTGGGSRPLTGIDDLNITWLAPTP